MLNRRKLLATGAAALVAPAVLRAQPREIPALRDLGSAKGIQIGSAFSLNDDPKYRALIAKHCEIITPEWQMKPPRIRKTADAPYDFSTVDRFETFCREHKQKLHGHTLYWAIEPIDWAVGKTFEETKQLYGSYIRTVMARYPHIESWDVLNELVDDEADWKLRANYIIAQYGYDFIDFCFRVAREMAPKAKLAINDYWIECAAEMCEGKRGGVLNLLAKLKARGTPIDAIGLQSHLYSRLPVSPGRSVDFIRQAAEMGLEAWISEIDVNDSRFPEDTATRDAMVADVYERYLSAVLAESTVKRLVFWGISDFDNWIAYGGSEWDSRAPGTGAPRPAIFDANNDPKPAFDAIVRVLRDVRPR